MAQTPTASPLDLSRSRFSCVFYVANGVRCQTPGPPNSFLCERHLLHFHRKKPQELFREAAEAIADCTSFAKNGLPFLICKDVDRWGDLANAARGLEELYGYNHLDETFPLLTSRLLSIDQFHRSLVARAPKKWKAFEVLVARLYLEELTRLVGSTQADAPKVGVEVRWNVRILGRITKGRRQVDVAIKTRLGSVEAFYAVECKDEKVQVPKVEAFKTKLEDIGADRGIMVSSIGYASGAESAARFHGIKTYLVEELSQTESVLRSVTRWTPRASQVTMEPPKEIRGDIEIVRADVVCLASGIEVSGSTIVDRAMDHGEVVKDRPLTVKLDLPGSAVVSGDHKERPLADVIVAIRWYQEQATVSLDLPRHPAMFQRTNLASGEVRTVGSRDLPLLASRFLEAGKYYTNPMCQFYYCDKVEGDLATIFLLNDGQYGHRLSMVMLANLDNSIYYYPLQDRKKIRELRSVMEWIQLQEGPKPERVQNAKAALKTNRAIRPRSTRSPLARRTILD